MKTLLHNSLLEITTSYREKTAVIFDGINYSYDWMNNASNNMAAYLQNSDFKRGDRGIICLGNSVEAIVSFWAIIKAGGVVSNIGFEITSDNLKYIISDAEPSIVISRVEKIEGIKELLDTETCVKNVIVVGDSVEGAKERMYEEVISYNANAVIDSGVLDIDLASIIYTSGSTGAPKGVMLTHRNMSAALSSLNSYLEYSDRDRVLCALPMSFDYGLYQMIMSFSVGATLVLEKEFTWPIFLVRNLSKYEITVFPIVPTLLMLLHEYMGHKNLTSNEVCKVTNTGAAINENHISMARKIFPNAEIFSMYGLTECKRCTYLPPADIDRKPGSVGVAIPNTELWLIDDDNNRIDKPNVIGQLVIRGSTVMAGYWRKPEQTQARLKAGIIPGDIVLHTGDYCRLDEEGYLFYEGRMDHVIKSAGMKVSPLEVDNHLVTIEGIETAAVIGVEHVKKGEVLCAFVTLLKGVDLTAEEIINQCANTLEYYKVPQYVIILDTLPKTANGKFDLVKLKNTNVFYDDEEEVSLAH